MNLFPLQIKRKTSQIGDILPASLKNPDTMQIKCNVILGSGKTL